MVKLFLQSGRTGFYLSVMQEGELRAGDTISLLRARESTLAVAEVTTLYAHDAENQELLKRATEVPALPEAWREYFRERLWEPDSTEK